MAHRRMVAGRGILRNHGRNSNSPATGQNSFRSFGSSPVTGATRRAAPSLQSSGIVRIDFRPVLIYMYICALHAHAGSPPAESSCCIVFTPTPPRTAPFWGSAEVLANDSWCEKKRMRASGRPEERLSPSPMVIQSRNGQRSILLSHMTWLSPRKLLRGHR